MFLPLTFNSSMSDIHNRPKIYLLEITQSICQVCQFRLKLCIPKDGYIMNKIEESCRYRVVKFSHGQKHSVDWISTLSGKLTVLQTNLFWKWSPSKWLARKRASVCHLVHLLFISSPKWTTKTIGISPHNLFTGLGISFFIITYNNLAEA